MSLPNHETPATPSPRRWLALLALAIVVPFLWLAAVRLAALDRGENSHDAYYHITMGDSGVGRIAARRFPELTMSVWEEQFCNKELAFHLLIAAGRGCQRLVGAAGEPPFHAVTLGFTLLLLASFAYAAFRFELPWTPALAALLAAMSPFFTRRIVMLRPHNLGIALMLLATALLISRCGRWRGRLAFGLGVLFAYSYSQPHFVLLPAIAGALAGWRRGDKRPWLLPLLALAGWLAGYTVHPQFPYTFITWKIQCVDVVRQILADATPVYLGSELAAPGRAWLLANSAVFVLAAVDLALLGVLWRRGGGDALGSDTLACLFMQALTVFGVFLSMRTMEYACPFTVLATGLLLRDLERCAGDAWPASRTRKIIGVTACFAAVAAMALVGHRQVQHMRQRQVRPSAEFGRWAQQAAIPAGTVVANLAWSDFPVLFYSAPQFRYLMGIDPFFAYHRMPERVTRLERFRTGQLRLSPSELAELCGAQLAFISTYGASLSKQMYEDGYFILYQGPDGWLFDLTRTRASQTTTP